ncbi:unnamed protein product [Prorocentrum cordatum]|uniref:Uncharacterized protein n=1 Tax=Prorocentrum cordatum TaxID=2364126 RepID=A0ABN9RV85_9DINO|nr:unnamed protein product [Polarella glacialis]
MNRLNIDQYVHDDSNVSVFGLDLSFNPILAESDANEFLTTLQTECLFKRRLARPSLGLLSLAQCCLGGDERQCDAAAAKYETLFESIARANVRDLDLDGNYLGPVVRMLVTELVDRAEDPERLGGVEALRLGHNGIRDPQVTFLLPLLNHCRSLTCLDLSYNNLIQDRGLRNLASGLVYAQKPPGAVLELHGPHLAGHIGAGRVHHGEPPAD